MVTQRASTRQGVRVRDVADAAGVSLGTVSNVLNRPDTVSPETRARVQAVMDQLGFVRNEFARQLRAGTSSTLAYVMLDGANPFFMDVAQGIEEEAQANGLALFLCNSSGRSDRELSYLTRLEEQRVQGILITPTDPDAAVLDELVARGTPVVILDRRRDSATHCSVAVDDVLGGELAAGHLVEMGHRRIAFVGGPSEIGQVRDRREGALRGLARAGMEPDRLVDIPTTGLTVAEGARAGERLLGLPAQTRPTAAFCANDLLALGLLQQCVSLGLRVPGDLAIVGYDDIEFAAAAAVPLTSVRQPRQLLGRTAAALLVREVRDQEHRHEQVLFAPELVVRRSTRSSD
ncbi:LacI family DNA-binding transcriptional regulator [Nocardia amikacinitolerans]|uniref:LacI family DNA-binding transcriptional regulator n=1 Tax=Nocardia amikacinitolerans TaxID=756689 RepID=UPI0036A11208